MDIGIELTPEANEPNEIVNLLLSDTLEKHHLSSVLPTSLLRLSSWGSDEMLLFFLLGDHLLLNFAQMIGCVCDMSMTVDSGPWPTATLRKSCTMRSMAAAFLSSRFFNHDMF